VHTYEHAVVCTHMKYVVSNYLTVHICTNENAASVLKTI